MRTLCAQYLLAPLGLLALLAACAGDPPRAPVENRYGQRVGQDAMVPERYKVKRGDTLYAIAWRYGFDFRKLAGANAIPAPYTIYVGQTLALREAAAVVTPVEKPPLASAPASRPATARKKTPTPSVQEVSAVSETFSGTWLWPTTGKVVRDFSGTVHKGIDIGGKAGDAVRAVAGGTVVYAGSGLVGYGKLLIVKHSEVYLSAYGHNRSLLVGEGARVAAGQRIAEKGSSATNSVKLHFEIRREGKPVDPLKMLPGR